MFLIVVEFVRWIILALHRPHPHLHIAAGCNVCVKITDVALDSSHLIVLSKVVIIDYSTPQLLLACTQSHTTVASTLSLSILACVYIGLVSNHMLIDQFIVIGRLFFLALLHGFVHTICLLFVRKPYSRPPCKFIWRKVSRHDIHLIGVFNFNYILFY